ncbi:MAG TPA: HAD-IA family hydrolase [Longilinea sp.]|nr:HAD-IA family hydrolase [Longilinea sp.]
MAIRGILWDMDGVLIDTTEAHFESWRQVMAERNMELDHQYFLGALGMNNAGAIEYLFRRRTSPQEVAAIGREKEALFRKILKGRVHLLPGVQDWLDYFGANGFHQAVATSAPWENIDTLLDETSIRSHFQAIVSAYEMPGKPDPYVFLKAAKKIGINAVECLVIEDSVAGVEAANRAGMKCLAVETSNPAGKLNQANWVLNRLSDQSPEQFLAQIDKQ